MPLTDAMIIPRHSQVTGTPCGAVVWGEYESPVGRSASKVLPKELAAYALSAGKDAPTNHRPCRPDEVTSLGALLPHASVWTRGIDPSEADCHREIASSIPPPAMGNRSYKRPSRPYRTGALNPSNSEARYSANCLASTSGTEMTQVQVLPTQMLNRT